MWHLADSIRRIRTFAIGAAMLTLIPLAAEGASLLQIKWDDLSIVALQTVRIALPGGAVITGLAVGVESDALVVNVTKTTDRKACAKGQVRVPRATLHRLVMYPDDKKSRVIATLRGGVWGYLAARRADQASIIIEILP